MASRTESRTWVSGDTVYYLDAALSIGGTRPAAWRPSGWRHFDTGSGVLEYWDGSAWQTVSADGHTHTQSDITDLSGTAFPGSPSDGDTFYRTDHYEAYHFDSTSSLWVSDSIRDIQGGDSGTLSASTYARMQPIAGTARYSTTVGWSWDYDVRVVGMMLWAFSSSTCTVHVRDDGADVTGANISLSSATRIEDETLFSNTIAAGSVIGLYNDATGAMNGAALIRASLRRVES